MEKLTPYLNKIETILEWDHYSEIDLFQLYNSYTEEQQVYLVAALIGKVIEQHKRLKQLN